MGQNKDIIMMRSTELKRYQTIQAVLDKKINEQEASEYLGLSDRRIRRIVKRVRKEAEHGVIHQLRGKAVNGNRRRSDRHKGLELYRKNSWDFGPALASEKLFERDGVKIL